MVEQDLELEPKVPDRFEDGYLMRSPSGDQGLPLNDGLHAASFEIRDQRQRAGRTEQDALSARWHIQDTAIFEHDAIEGFEPRTIPAEFFERAAREEQQP